ncbi:protein lethal(2)essential for life-like [Trichoplusia ni]|uniref:Protein lethal(2)essential for life-like n=1 Tax=Trichoplusia ni TaxID=7111 RepID=A0A7E5VZU7_TRINI|nr:protein lethal(2)essential for life-like [Trichoplusia ni]
MPLRPFFLNYDLPQFPRSLLDQSFGLALTPQDIASAAVSPLSPLIAGAQPWWPKPGSTVKIDKDKCQINVDVQHFAPDEITVKTSNGYIVIEGKHEEKEDEHGYVSRQFVRRFKLPEESDPDLVESRLSSDGILTVVAPKKSEAVTGERAVPITHTGPVRQDVANVETPSK